MVDTQIQSRKFSWMIQNVYLCYKLLDSKIESPPFEQCVRPNCPWMLQLGQSDNPDDAGIQLFIELGGNYKKTLVNFRVLVYEGSTKLLNRRFQRTFKEGIKWASPILITNSEFREKFISTDDLVNVWNIQVEIIYNNVQKMMDLSDDLMEKREVGVALKNHLDDPMFSDIFIKVGDDEILAHKAILHARSPFFAEKLSSIKSTESNEDAFDSMSNPQIVKLLLLYMYSGDIYSVMSRVPLPVGIHEYAQQMGLYDLEWLTQPFESSGRTRVVKEVATLEFTIERFSDAIKSNSPTDIKSRPFGNDSDVFELLVNVTKKKSSRNVSVCLNMISKEKVYVFLTVSIKSKSKPISFKKKLAGFLKPDCSLVFPEFITVDELVRKRYMHQGSLCLSTKILYAKGELNTNIEKVLIKSTVETEDSKLPTEDMYCATLNGYSIVSRDMESLMETSAFSDCTIVVEDLRLPAHKVILAARSLYFYDKFRLKDESRDPDYADSMDVSINEVVVDKDIDITLQQMKLILEEIYTGSAKIANSDVALEMYPFAQYFSLSNLLNKCARKMKCVPAGLVPGKNKECGYIESAKDYGAIAGA